MQRGFVMKLGDWVRIKLTNEIVQLGERKGWGHAPDGYFECAKYPHDVFEPQELSPLTVEDAFRFLGDVPEGAKIVSFLYEDSDDAPDDKYWAIIDGEKSTLFTHGKIFFDAEASDFEQYGIPLNRLPVDAEVFQLLPKAVQEKLEESNG
jgi:hypothetical protein